MSMEVAESVKNALETVGCYVPEGYEDVDVREIMYDSLSFISVWDLLHVLMVLVIDLCKIGLNDLNVGPLATVCIAHKYCDLICKKKHVVNSELELISGKLVYIDLHKR